MIYSLIVNKVVKSQEVSDFALVTPKEYFKTFGSYPFVYRFGTSNVLRKRELKA